MSHKDLTNTLIPFKLAIIDKPNNCKFLIKKVEIFVAPWKHLHPSDRRLCTSATHCCYQQTLEKFNNYQTIDFDSDFAAWICNLYYFILFFLLEKIELNT